MAAAPHPCITPEQYLEIEHEAEFKSEYLSGQSPTPGGTTLERTLTLANLGIEIAAADIYAGVALRPAAGPEIRMG